MTVSCRRCADLGTNKLKNPKRSRDIEHPDQIRSIRITKRLSWILVAFTIDPRWHEER